MEFSIFKSPCHYQVKAGRTRVVCARKPRIVSGGFTPKRTRLTEQYVGNRPMDSRIRTPGGITDHGTDVATRGGELQISRNN